MRWMFGVLAVVVSMEGVMAQPLWFSWKYKGQDYSMELGFLRTHYRKYQGQSKEQAYTQYLKEFPGHMYHLALAHKLDSLAKRAGCQSNLEVAAFLLAFVQEAIQYRSDKTITPYNYPKYAIETLVEGWGDCEDKAILTATLFRVFGFNPVLLKYSSHVAVGLQCLDCPGSIRSGTQQFAYVESTARGWKIGEVPERYRLVRPGILYPGM